MATATPSLVASNVRTLCKSGRLKEALHVLYLMDHRDIPVDSSTYAFLLESCGKKKALPEGKLVCGHIIQTGFRCPDVFLWNTLVSLYAKCGSLDDACRAFDEMPERNVVSWTTMIAAYVRLGYAKEALTLFGQMQRAGIQPNHFTFASVLPACANLAALEQGKEIHEEIIRSGYQADVFLQNALVDMYSKCGSIEKARNIFDKMPERDVVSYKTYPDRQEPSNMCRLPLGHQIHLQDCCTRNYCERCQTFSSLQGWNVFLWGLLVMLRKTSDKHGLALCGARNNIAP